MTASPQERIRTPFDEAEGWATFRGVPVAFTEVRIGAESFELAGLRDAADLLDVPEYADRFVQQDMAPYGLQLWPSSIALAEHLVNHERSREKRRAIELGCGMGLVSVALARAGWDVTATDYDPTTLAFAAFNAHRNKAPVLFTKLDWRNPQMSETYDLVAAADVAYQVSDHEPLLRCIGSLLAAGGRAFIADPGRSVADRLPDAARRAGFHVEDVMRSDAPSQTGVPSSMRIWRLCRS